MQTRDKYGVMGNWLVALALAIYGVLLVTAEKVHTFWRDEAEAWIVARDSHGIGALLHNVRYEGHPAGWYAVLYGVTRFTTNVEWMKVPNVVFAMATAATILCTKQVALPVRLGVVFSYFFMFEYAVLDRNYMMGIMFLVAACLLMQRGNSVFGIAVLLGLAALTSLPALIVAVCLYAVSLLPVMEHWRALNMKRMLAILLFAACVLVSLAEIRPPDDSGLLLDSQPRRGLARTLTHPFHDVAKAYLPMPKWKVAFWDTNMFDGISSAGFTLVGMVIAAGLCMFFRKRAPRVFLIGASALLLGQMMVSRRTDARHVGWLFIVFVLALFIDATAESADETIEGFGWKPVLLYGTLAVQVAAGLFAVTTSMRHVFSGSRQAAEFLRTQNLDRGPMVFAPDFVSLSILAYLRRPTAYYVERHAEGSIVVWDKVEFYGRHVPSGNELREASHDGSKPVLITQTPLNEEQLSELGVHRLAVISGEIYPEAYFMYR